MVFVPPSREYNLYKQDIFYVAFTLHAARVEWWIRRVKEQSLDVAPTNCVGLNYE
jgi:hypothetical protein